MNKRNTTFIVVLALLLGSLVGGSGVYFTLLRRTKSSVLKQMSTIMAAEHLWHLRLLRENKHGEVLSLLEGTLPDTVRWYTAFGYREPADIRLLWRIKDYCSRYDVSVPSEIQVMLDSLPPIPPLVCTTDGSAVVEPDGPANGSQPVRSETSPTSSAAGSRR